MTIKEIRQQASQLGVKNITRYRKDSLIRVIQEQEGNAPCFRSIDQCGEIGCLWRDECQG